MKKHPWWKGATITNVALVSELNRRKNTVDQVKSKEKERKKKEKERESTLGGPTKRALGDDETQVDDLPMSPPKFTFKHHVYTTAAPEPTGDLCFDEDETDSKDQKVATLDSTIIRYTRFNSIAAPSKIVDRVSEVVKMMGGRYSSKEGFKLKVVSGAVSFIAQVFADPKIEAQYVVDFRKKKGSGLEFRNVYQDIRANLADIILQPKVESSESLESGKTMEVEES